MNRKIWIWGMGDAGKLMLNFFKSKSIAIKGLIDNSDKLCHKDYGGYKIISLEEAKLLIEKDDMIICCCSLTLYETFKKCLSAFGHSRYENFYEVDMGDFTYSTVDEGHEAGIVSKLCTEIDFRSKDFQIIRNELMGDEEQVLYRKTWEWVYIIQVLQHYKMLGNGKRGIGFAVGREPLPSYFAGKQNYVLASDLTISEESAKKWADTNQHASGNLKNLWYGRVCSKDLFEQYVKYRDIDMNDLPTDEKDYDFCWSSCAIEHVGSLEKSKLFLKNMLDVLKSGGVAIHTTEFNLSSNDATIEEGDSVIFRKKDIEELKEWFQKHGHYMETSYKRAKTEGNSYVDISPFHSEYKPYHLSLAAEGYAETSFAIVVVKDGLK